MTAGRCPQGVCPFCSRWSTPPGEELQRPSLQQLLPPAARRQRPARVPWEACPVLSYLAQVVGSPWFDLLNVLQFVCVVCSGTFCIAVFTTDVLVLFLAITCWCAPYSAAATARKLARQQHSIQAHGNKGFFRCAHPCGEPPGRAPSGKPCAAACSRTDTYPRQGTGGRELSAAAGGTRATAAPQPLSSSGYTNPAGAMFWRGMCMPPVWRVGECAWEYQCSTTQ